MSPLENLLDNHPMPTWRRIAWPIMVLLIALFVWSNYATLDEVSVAQGEVVPKGNIKVIQHLEGGIVEAIHVEEGDVVKVGQPLIQLDLGTAGVNKDELQVRLDNELLVRARLEAESQGTDLQFPDDVAKRRPAQALAEERTYVARKRQLEAKVSVQDEIIRQRKLDVEEIHAKMKALQDKKRELSSTSGTVAQQIRQKELDLKELQAKKTTIENNLKLLQERFAMSQKLVADGLVPRMEHLQLEGDLKSMEGDLAGVQQSIPRARAAVAEARGNLKDQIDQVTSDINSLVPSIPRAEAALGEARQRTHEMEIQFRREAQDDLSKSEQTIGRIKELLAQATEQKIRADIRSPIDGIVKNMRFNTIGGVVKPGEPIMEIVPIGDNLVVEAKLAPTDRGYVNVGQSTMVKISTYDYARYGGLTGRVTMVAPDTSTDDKGNPYFRVLVETDKTYLGQRAGELPIVPGMQATVDIHTGSRTVLDYLMKPVLKMRDEAFRER